MSATFISKGESHVESSSISASFEPESSPEDKDWSQHLSKISPTDSKRRSRSSNVFSGSTSGSPKKNKKNADFHTLFKSIPTENDLVEDYSCALQKEILIQGRMYLTESHICFHANIFGWVTKCVISSKEILSIHKRMTAYIIPNGIEVVTVEGSFIFASFLQRDAVLNHIQGMLIIPSERKRSKSAQNLRELHLSQPELNVTYASQSNDGNALQVASVDDESMATPTIPPTIIVKDCTPAPTLDISDFDNVIVDRTLPFGLRRVHCLLYGKVDRSTDPVGHDFFKNFLIVRRDVKELQMSEWSNDAIPFRTVDYILPLKQALGPKQTKCCSREELQHENLDSMTLSFTRVTTPDVPSGNCFSTCLKVLLTQESGEKSTHIKVSVQVEWIKKSFLKGPIERATIEGNQSYWNDLCEELMSFCQVPKRSIRLTVDISQGITPNVAVPVANVPHLTHVSTPQQPILQEHARNVNQNQIDYRIIFASVLILLLGYNIYLMQKLDSFADRLNAFPCTCT